jgi:hypothetical protein
MDPFKSVSKKTLSESASASQKLKNVVFIQALILMMIGCVSVGLNDTKVQRSTKVRFSAPGGAFTEKRSDSLDHLWENSKNGNSISFMSDCSDTTDPSLESIQQGILHGVERLKVLSNETISYNDREALRSITSGSVDGVDTAMDLVVFKKNGCIYALNYVGVRPQFEDDKAAFSKFLDRFHAP